MKLLCIADYLAGVIRGHYLLLLSFFGTPALGTYRGYWRELTPTHLSELTFDSQTHFRHLYSLLQLPLLHR